MAKTKTDYLGDVATAFRRLDEVSPSKCQADINNSDQNPHRYGVRLWNIFGKWYASEATLAESIHVALDRAQIDNFGMPSSGRNSPQPPRAGRVSPGE